MDSELWTGHIFRGRGRELHVAPEGLAQTSSGVLADDPRERYASYAEVAGARSLPGWQPGLVIQFRDGRPDWRIAGMQRHHAQWARDIIAQAAESADARSGEAFAGHLALAQLGLEIEQLSRPPEPRLPEIVDLVLLQAVHHRASDVHFEPTPDGLQVRYRLDGVLVDVVQLPADLRARTLARLKVIGGMVTFRTDIAQEGRSQAEVGERTVDLRVSVLPTIHGEKATVRLFDPALMLLALDQLGIEADTLPLLCDLLSRPQGTILLTGPAGAGKTTTLYAALEHIRQERRSIASICTIEDPVEHEVLGVNQTEVRPESGLTFAAGLRTMLRQDPEVIMIGEIRDPETAAIATRAGLTGHLVLSTVHARSAAGVFARLMDMDVEPLLVASSVTGVVAQRLVRTICSACAAPARPSPEVLAKLGVTSEEVAGWHYQQGGGCARCDGTGYRGRTGIFELISVGDDLRSLIMQRLPAIEVERQAAAGAGRSLREAGLRKAAQGVTTVDEVLRLVGPVG